MSTPKEPVPQVAPRTRSFLDRIARNLVSPEHLPAPEPAPEPDKAVPVQAAEEKPIEPAAEAVPPPPPTPVVEKPTPPAPKKPATKPVIKDEDFEPTPAPAAPASASANAATVSLASLLGYEPTDAERDYLENLHWADGRDDRATHKGLFAKELERLKRVKGFEDRWKAENPDAGEDDFDARNAQLADGTTFRGVAGRPALSAEQQRRLEMDRVRVDAKEGADRAVDRVREETSRRLLEFEVKPKVAQRVAAFDAEVIEGMTFHEEPEINEELTKLVRGGGVASIAEDFAVEAEIVREEVDRAKEQASALMHIKAGLADYDPDNRTHVQVAEFVNREADFFEANGGEARVRDGRSFLTPAKFSKVKPDARNRYWTFSEDEIVRMMQHRARATAEARMEKHRSAIQKRSEAREKFRHAATPAATKAPSGTPEPERIASPVIRPSPAGHGGVPVVKPVNRLTRNILPGYAG